VFHAQYRLRDFQSVAEMLRLFLLHAFANNSPRRHCVSGRPFGCTIYLIIDDVLELKGQENPGKCRPCARLGLARFQRGEIVAPNS